MSTRDRLPWVSIGMPFCGGNSFQGRGNGNVVSCVKQKTLLFGCLTISLGSIHDPGGRDMPRSFPSFSEFPPQQQMKLQRLPSIYSGSSLSKNNNVFYRWNVICSVKATKEENLISLNQEMRGYWKLWVWFSSSPQSWLHHAFGPFFTVSNLHWMISTNANIYGYQLRMQAGNTMRGGSRCEVHGGTHGDSLSFEPRVAM